MIRLLLFKEIWSIFVSSSLVSLIVLLGALEVDGSLNDSCGVGTFFFDLRLTFFLKCLPRNSVTLVIQNVSTGSR